MRSLIVGNWKMHGARDSAIRLVSELAAGVAGLGCDLVVCPPFTLIYPLAQVLEGSRVALGGQDCHSVSSGAFTGDIAAPMLVEAGASYVILGHSERRQHHGETNAMVRAKIVAATNAPLIPIVCVGETEAERHLGHERDVVGRQLADSLPDDFDGVVAYEPIWAIGTGVTPTVGDVTAMHDFIRDTLTSRYGPAGTQTPLLYGGSVKSANASRLLAIPTVNGALVGGASLSASEFLAIARAVG